MNKKLIFAIIVMVYVVFAFSFMVAIPENPNYNYVTLNISLKDRIVNKNTSEKIHIEVEGGKYAFNNNQRIFKSKYSNTTSISTLPDYLYVYHTNYGPLPLNVNKSCQNKLFNFVSKKISANCTSNKSNKASLIINGTVVDLSNINRTVCLNINTSHLMPGFYFIKVNDFEFNSNHLMVLNTEIMNNIFEVNGTLD